MAKREGAALETFQSNHEGALIERVHGAKKQRISWIIVNPGGADSYQRGVTRRFGSGRDPFPRGALSNIYSREPFRRHSYFSDLAAGTICGLGSRGYDFALQFALHPN